MKTNDIERVVLKNGDIILIPLSEEKVAIGQLIYWKIEPKQLLNPLLRIVEGVFDIDTLDLNTIDITREMFPPIATGVRAAVRSGMWKKTGNLPTGSVPYPTFVSTFYRDDGTARDWWITDGNGSRLIGPELPEKYKKCEFEVVLNPPDVVERIRTGQITFPYGDLIKDNKFTPISKPRMISKEEKEAFSKSWNRR